MHSIGGYIHQPKHTQVQVIDFQLVITDWFSRKNFWKKTSKNFFFSEKQVNFTLLPTKKTT